MIFSQNNESYSFISRFLQGQIEIVINTNGLSVVLEFVPEDTVPVIVRGLEVHACTVTITSELLSTKFQPSLH